MDNEEQYDWAFKRSALDTVLREYASFFRVSKYMEDTRTLFLLSMCAMIDLAQSRSGSNFVNSGTNKDASDSLLSASPWDLDGLSREDKRYFSHANWPGNDGSLNAEQCYQRMLIVLRDSPFI